MDSFIASLRRNLVAELLIKHSSGPAVVTVTTYGGRTSSYSKEDLARMLGPDGQVLSMYQNADNLPRWIEQAGAAKVLVELPYGTVWMKNPNANKFPQGGWRLGRGWPQVSAIIQKIMESDHVVHVNVDSGARGNNGIKW